jgi:hypothetical protein
MRTSFVLLRIVIVIVIALSSVGWLFLAAFRWWTTDPRSLHWTLAGGSALSGAVDCKLEKPALLRGSQAWWACGRKIGNSGDDRFADGAIAWVDLERATGVLIPAEEQHPLSFIRTMMPADPAHPAVFVVYGSPRGDGFVTLSRMFTPRGWVGAPHVIAENADSRDFDARWQSDHFELRFKTASGTYAKARVALDGTVSAMTESPPEALPASEPPPPPTGPLCESCRLVQTESVAADLVDGVPRLRPRWEVRTPPDPSDRMRGEREAGDDVELLAGGFEVTSSETSAGIVRDGKLVNRTHSFGFPDGGWDMIWFARPTGGFRLYDAGGWYVSLNDSMHRTDPLGPVAQLSRRTPHRYEDLSIWAKFALYAWVLVGLPFGIVLFRRQRGFRRQKLLIALLAVYAFSLYVSMDLLRKHVELMHEVPARIG